MATAAKHMKKDIQVIGLEPAMFPSFTAIYSLYADIRHRGWHRDRAGH